MVNTPNLKPCPFCGGKAEIAKRGVFENCGRYIGIYCKECGANLTRTILPNYNALDECIKSWNRRTDDV